MRRAWLLLVTALPVCSAYAAPACAVTEPPRQIFVPPPPFDAVPYPGDFYLGTDGFWTSLPANGVWETLHDQPTYDRRKIGWFSKDFWWLSGQEAQLNVEARKLDGSHTSIHGGSATNAFLSDRQESFMLSAIEFPSTGCWEITARFRGQELKFTVLVTAPSN